MWRLRRVSDDKFLLQGSHRKSSVRPPLGVPTPPEAARDVDVIKGVDEAFVSSDDDKVFFLGVKIYRERDRERVRGERCKRPIISQSSTSHHHHVYKNIVSVHLFSRFWG